MKETTLGYMGFAEGMLVGRAMPDYNGGSRQIDWDLLKEFIEQHKTELESVVAGLSEDWGYTSGEVWNSKEGYINQDDTYVYASSPWATPAIDVTFKNGDSQSLECWKHGNDPSSYFAFSN